MGKRGPLPKNRALKVLSGKAPLMKEEVEILNEIVTDPLPPKHLSKREIEIWDMTLKLLKPLRIIKEADSAVIGAYCSTYARWESAEREINLSETKLAGLCVLNDDGNPRGINPLVLISRDSQKDMVFYAAQLGMTPAARMKMVSGVAKVVEKNPFMKIKEMKK